MLDRRPAAPRTRRRAQVGFAALVVLAHGLLLGEIDLRRVGAAPSRVGMPMSVRTIAAAAPVVAAPAEPVPVLDAPAPPPPSTPSPARRQREPARAVAVDPPVLAASAPEPASTAGVAAAEPRDVPPPREKAQEADAPAQASAALAVDAEPPSAAGAALPSLLGAGEQPPPVYRTRLPPPATLHYQVRTGFFRGTGEIRWRRNAEAYSLELEARVAGVPVLRMASDGAIDAAGLAPRRFVDQRARRAGQAANFQRDAGKVTFSGRAVEFPLYAGSQDQLSWMIQLAGIVSAEPGLLVDGARITMVVVGARGEARVWTLRFVGQETVETRAGQVSAVKLVRDGVGPYDRGYEIWLDPAHDFLPAHMTQRNGAGESVFDLLLDRIEPVP